MKELAVALLIAPDGRIILQRRGKSAKISAGKLGFFGGHIEEGETPREACIRELSEETLLPVGDLSIGKIGFFEVSASSEVSYDRRFYLFKVKCPDTHIEDREGEGAEVYSLEELRNRNDLSAAVQNALQQIEEGDL